MVEPIRTVDEYLLRTTAGIGRDYVEEQKQLIFATLQDYLFEHESSLRPPVWTKALPGDQVPEMEGFLIGLFDTPSADELANYRKVTRSGRRR